jgi:hypothetical protein
VQELETLVAQLKAEKAKAEGQRDALEVKIVDVATRNANLQARNEELSAEVRTLSPVQHVFLHDTLSVNTYAHRIPSHTTKGIALSWAYLKGSTIKKLN